LLETLGSNNAEMQHPFTREPLRLTRRGSLDVLAFAAGTTRLSGNGSSDTDLVWRVPAAP